MLPWFGWKRHYTILHELSHLSHVCEDADLRKFVAFEHFFYSIVLTLLKISFNTCMLTLLIQLIQFPFLKHLLLSAYVYEYLTFYKSKDLVSRQPLEKY